MALALDYTLTLARDPLTVIAVELRAAGDLDGESAFALDRWGSDEDPFDAVREVSFSAADGAPLPWSRHDDVLVVRHEPGAALVLRYVLVPPELTVTHDNQLRPILDGALFRGIIENTLLVPDVSDDTALDVSLHWRGFEDAGWSVVSSFGADPKGAHVSTRLDRFRQSLVLAGPLRVRTTEAVGGPVTIAVTGDEWGFTDDAFAAAVGSIIDAERRVWGGERAFFLVALLPVGAPSATDLHVGGTALSDSFELEFTPGSALTPLHEHVIAHEMFHLWNGTDMRLAWPEARWFQEGFTEFYARRVLYQSGRLAVDGYVDALNDHLRDVYLGGTSEDQVVYRRGELAALLLDAEVRRSTRGKEGLEVVMREVQAWGPGDSPRDTATLLELAAGHTSVEFAARLRSWIVDDQLPEVPLDLFGRCLEGRDATVVQWDPGVDLFEAHRSSRIGPVRVDSPAWVAGLREGDAVTKVSADTDEPTTPVTVVLSDRTVSFVPGVARQVVQFAPSAKAAKWCTGIL